MQTKKLHWGSLITLIVLIGSAFFLLLLVAVLLVASLIGLFSQEGDPASQMISAWAFGFAAIVLFICSWFVLQKIRGLEQADLPVKLSLPVWAWIVTPLIVLTGIALGVGVSFAGLPWLSWLFLPLLSVLVIVLPILFFFGIAGQSIDAGSRWRFFATLGLGMTVGPFIMIVLEVIVIAVIFVGGAVYLSMTQPAILQEVTSLVDLFNEGIINEEAMLTGLAPYISNPALLTILLGYVALIVPLIEELFKPLAVWIFARRVDSPAQGFVLGALSGLAFALIESLNASADSSVSWGVIVGARAGTSLLHLTTSALVGWGIVSLFKEKRFGRFFGAYFSAVLVHGIWNAAAAGAGIASIGELIGKPEWLFNLAPALIGGLIVLAIGMFVVLLRSNRRLRTESKPIHPEEVKVESPA